MTGEFPAQGASSADNVSIWWRQHVNSLKSLHRVRYGPWFNIKKPSYQYRKSHCGDETVLGSSYLNNGISYTSKVASLYWTNPLVMARFFSLEMTKIYLVCRNWGKGMGYHKWMKCHFIFAVPFVFYWISYFIQPYCSWTWLYHRNNIKQKIKLRVYVMNKHWPYSGFKMSLYSAPMRAPIYLRPD